MITDIVDKHEQLFQGDWERDSKVTDILLDHIIPVTSHTDDLKVVMRQLFDNPMDEEKLFSLELLCGLKINGHTFYANVHSAVTHRFQTQTHLQDNKVDEVFKFREGVDYFVHSEKLPSGRYTNRYYLTRTASMDLLVDSRTFAGKAVRSMLCSVWFQFLKMMEKIKAHLQVKSTPTPPPVNLLPELAMPPVSTHAPTPVDISRQVELHLYALGAGQYHVIRAMDRNIKPALKLLRQAHPGANEVQVFENVKNAVDVYDRLRKLKLPWLHFNRNKVQIIDLKYTEEYLVSIIRAIIETGNAYILSSEVDLSKLYDADRAALQSLMSGIRQSEEMMAIVPPYFTGYTNLLTLPCTPIPEVEDEKEGDDDTILEDNQGEQTADVDELCDFLASFNF